eukprot:1156815-Pelagomonas_calceolata.AAC.10
MEDSTVDTCVATGNWRRHHLAWFLRLLCTGAMSRDTLFLEEQTVLTKVWVARFRGVLVKRGTMLSFYFLLLSCLGILAVVIEFVTGRLSAGLEGAPVLPLSFVSFRNNYLFIYSLAMGELSLANLDSN